MKKKDLLKLLQDNPDGMTTRQMAAALNVSHASVQALVSHRVKENLPIYIDRWTEGMNKTAPAAVYAYGTESDWPLVTMKERVIRVLAEHGPQIASAIAELAEPRMNRRAVLFALHHYKDMFQTSNVPFQIGPNRWVSTWMLKPDVIHLASDDSEGGNI